MIFGISLGYFMVLLDMTVLAVAEPDLVADLHASTAGLQWATAAYTVTFAALLLVAGAISDRIGADRAFRLGVAVFALVSGACAGAPGIAVLIALRAVLGAAAALCVPASLALIAQVRPGAAARAKAVAAWAAISGAAVAAGPIVGGALVAWQGWRAVFVVNVPIGVIVLLTRLAPAERSPRRIDWLAQLYAVAVLALTTAAVIERSLVLGLAAVLVAAAGYGKRPRAGVPTGALVAAGAVNFALTGVLFVLPLLEAGRWSALQTGLAFLPLTVPFVAGPPLTGRLVARYGPLVPIRAGLGLLVAGGVVLSAAIHAAYPWIAAGLLLTGAGVSLTLPALATMVVSAARPGTTGAAGGLLNAVRQAGATLGVAVMGATAGRTALVISAVVCLAGYAVRKDTSSGLSAAGSSRLGR